MYQIMVENSKGECQKMPETVPKHNHCSGSCSIQHPMMLLLKLFHLRTLVWFIAKSIQCCSVVWTTWWLQGNTLAYILRKCKGVLSLRQGKWGKKGVDCRALPKVGIMQSKLTLPWIHFQIFHLITCKLLQKFFYGEPDFLRSTYCVRGLLVKAAGFPQSYLMSRGPLL